jgi:hypothetical protein
MDDMNHRAVNFNLRVARKKAQTTATATDRHFPVTRRLYCRRIIRTPRESSLASFKALEHSMNA